MTGNSTSPLQVGVLLLGNVQFIDASSVDLLDMITPDYLRSGGLPDTLVAQGRDVSFHYIAESGAGSHTTLSADVKLLVTDSLDSVGHLDLLLVPGPSISYVPSPAVQEFLRNKLDEVSTLFTVCTGVIPVAHTGLLNGKAATGTQIIMPMLREKFKDVKWEDKRWTRDGKIWTSGGITNGFDMMAAYIRETFPPDIAAFVCDLADVGDRGQEYSK